VEGGERKGEDTEESEDWEGRLESFEVLSRGIRRVRSTTTTRLLRIRNIKRMKSDIEDGKKNSSGEGELGNPKPKRPVALLEEGNETNRKKKR
jgi:hypothetical protein